VLDLGVLLPTPTVPGDRVRLEPLTVDVADAYLRMLEEPEGRRFTGTHQTFTRQQVLTWLESRAEAPERADWAIVDAATGAFLGEAVLLDVDADNHSGGFRIALRGPDVYGNGYGTEATRLVADFAFGRVGLHRLALEVYDFNLRGIAAYRKSGFHEEGRLRDALRWDGQWYDTIVMSRLSTDPPFVESTT
jgi:RimJ/RimL family protein N-acetyltransferase